MTRMIIKCNITGKFSTKFFNLVTRYLVPTLSPFFFPRHSTFFILLPQIFFPTRTTIIHDIQSYISIITSSIAGLIFPVDTEMNIKFLLSLISVSADVISYEILYINHPMDNNILLITIKKEKFNV